MRYEQPAAYPDFTSGCAVRKGAMNRGINDDAGGHHAINSIEVDSKIFCTYPPLPDCACSDVVIDKKILKKGDSARVTFIYTGRPIREAVERLSAVIVSNDPQKPLYRLGLSLNLIKSVFWYPSGVSFHSDYGLNDRYQLITFLTDYADNMIINEIATTSDKIMAEILKNNGVFQCRVSLNPDCPEGNWAERVTIHARINDWDKVIAIPVNLMIYK